jgi:hypothetical protein
LERRKPPPNVSSVFPTRILTKFGARAKNFFARAFVLCAQNDAPKMIARNEEKIAITGFFHLTTRPAVGSLSRT